MGLSDPKLCKCIYTVSICVLHVAPSIQMNLVSRMINLCLSFFILGGTIFLELQFP